MGKGKHLRPGQIAVITALCQAEKSNIYISNYNGINLRTVQLWTKKFRESVDGDVQLQKKQTGRPRKVVPATLRLLKREIEKNPFITARKIRENNSVLQDMSLHTIRKALRVDLQYKRRVAKRKPLLTARQKRMRLALARDKIKCIGIHSEKYCVLMRQLSVCQQETLLILIMYVVHRDQIHMILNSFVAQLNSLID